MELELTAAQEALEDQDYNRPVPIQVVQRIAAVHEIERGGCCPGLHETSEVKAYTNPHVLVNQFQLYNRNPNLHPET